MAFVQRADGYATNIGYLRIDFPTILFQRWLTLLKALTQAHQHFAGSRVHPACWNTFPEAQKS